jgi:large subunit ribosomal protein L10
MLSTLKGKEELIGEIIGLLQSPMKNVISGLQGSGGTQDRWPGEDPQERAA